MSPPSAATAHPYQSLTPDVVLDALASVDLYGDGRLLALGSYENRVYQIHLEDGSAVVAKFYRPGRWSEAQILEEHVFAAELMAAEIPVVGPLSAVAPSRLKQDGAPSGGSAAHEVTSVGAPHAQGHTLHSFGGFAFSVSPSRGGRPPELDDFEVLEWIGRFLARIHTVGAARPFQHRPALDLESFGIASRDWLLAHDKIPLDVQGAWQAACTNALDLIANISVGTRANGSFDAEPVQHIRLHGDCHPGNILWTPTDTPGGGPHFVDLDDARTGPAVQDLWMLTSGDRRQRTAQLSGLLDGYEQFREFDRRELALIEPLRTLRLIHYSAWLARRWDDPTFAINFPWFGSSDYWRGQVDMLHEQIEAMQEPPLAA